MRMEDSLQAFAVRAACFIGELDVPYSEEFDGHDFGATHIIAYVGDEPVGTLRVRWFQSFAMPERLAVIQRFRGHNIGQLLLERGRKLAESRGCNMLYAQVLPADVEYWEKQGWRRLVAEDAAPATSGSWPWCGRSIPASRCPTSRRRNRSCCAARPSSTLRPAAGDGVQLSGRHRLAGIGWGEMCPGRARYCNLLKARGHLCWVSCRIVALSCRYSGENGRPAVQLGGTTPRAHPPAGTGRRTDAAAKNGGMSWSRSSLSPTFGGVAAASHCPARRGRPLCSACGTACAS